MVERVSPLDGLLVKGHYGRQPEAEDGGVLVLSSRMCASLLQVNCWPDTIKKVKSTIQKSTGLKLSTGQAASANENFTVMPLGPGRYLIESAKPDMARTFRDKIPADLGAVVGLTHARVVIRISGKKTTWVLSKGIAIDFSRDTFPIASCIVTSHHDIGLTIRREDEDTFDIFVFTSLARSFWQWLDKAAREVGYEIR